MFNQHTLKIVMFLAPPLLSIGLPMPDAFLEGTWKMIQWSCANAEFRFGTDTRRDQGIWVPYGDSRSYQTENGEVQMLADRSECIVILADGRRIDTVEQDFDFSRDDTATRSARYDSKLAGGNVLLPIQLAGRKNLRFDNWPNNLACCMRFFHDIVKQKGV
jgi:hypothetical protein